jgi:hypothetical protein
VKQTAPTALCNLQSAKLDVSVANTYPQFLFQLKKPQSPSSDNGGLDRGTMGEVFIVEILMEIQKEVLELATFYNVDALEMCKVEIFVRHVNTYLVISNNKLNETLKESFGGEW